MKSSSNFVVEFQSNNEISKMGLSIPQILYFLKERVMQNDPRNSSFIVRRILAVSMYCFLIFAAIATAVAQDYSIQFRNCAYSPASAPIKFAKSNDSKMPLYICTALNNTSFTFLKGLSC